MPPSTVQLADASVTGHKFTLPAFTLVDLQVPGEPDQGSILCGPCLETKFVPEPQMPDLPGGTRSRYANWSAPRLDMIPVVGS